MVILKHKKTLLHNAQMCKQSKTDFLSFSVYYFFYEFGSIEIPKEPSSTVSHIIMDTHFILHHRLLGLYKGNPPPQPGKEHGTPET